jgi:type II secretory pathway predicted ATPase ExeA
MLSEVMEHYGLLRDFMEQAAFFETDHARHMLRELKLAITLGKLVVLSGIGGCGKTTMLRRVQESIEQEKEILVSKALSVEKSQIHLGGLIVALFADLATDKDVKIPTQPEWRERALRDLVKKRQKPIALLIDDAHDLHPKTLLGLKRLIEVVRDSGGTLSVVLAGHPRLKNSLERPAMEEIGLSRNCRDGPHSIVEGGSGSREMIAAHVHCGRRYGHLYSSAAELARCMRPLDAEGRAGALAHPRPEHSRRGPVSPLWAGDS